MALAQFGKLALVTVGAVAFRLFAGFGLVGAVAQFLDQLFAQGITGGAGRCRGLCRWAGRSEHPDQLGHEEEALAAFQADLVASDLAGGDLALDGALADAEDLDGLGQGDKGLCHSVPGIG